MMAGKRNDWEMHECVVESTCVYHERGVIVSEGLL